METLQRNILTMPPHKLHFHFYNQSTTELIPKLQDSN